MIKIKNVTSEEKRENLRNNYSNTLLTPIDGYWEKVVIGNSTCYEISYNKKIVGHFFVDSHKTLVEFYIFKDYYIYSQEIFKYIIESDMVENAAVSTRQSEFLSLCLDFQKSLYVSAYLFTDADNKKHELYHCENLSFRLAKKGDIKVINNKCESRPQEYYEELIRNEQLFVLYEGDILLGIGEFRINRTHSGQYADIGMVVAEEHRRKGFGTYIIIQLKEHCYRKKLKPMASCDRYNVASKNTLLKAGFISEHRIINVRFN